MLVKAAPDILELHPLYGPSGSNCQYLFQRVDKILKVC